MIRNRLTRPSRRAGFVVVSLLFAAPVATLAVNADSDPEPRLSAAERADLTERLEASRDQTLALVSNVSDSEWSRQPGDDRWSVSDVVEHLVLAEGTLQARVQSLSEGEEHPQWRTIDRMTIDHVIARASDRSTAFQAPEPIRPSGELSRAELLERFSAARQRTIELVRTTDAPLKSHAAPNPLVGDANGRHWIAFVVGHNLRHNQQIASIKSVLQ